MTEDWSRWSRESVALFQARNRDWQSRFGIQTQPYRYDLDTATLTFDRGADVVVADGDVTYYFALFHLRESPKRT